MERSLSYVNLSILKKQTRDNNTVFNNISLQTEFFHLHQISYRGAT